MFTVVFKVIIDSFHDREEEGGSLLVTFETFLPQSWFSASVGPNQHVATNILVFTETVCVIHALSCVQLFIHTTHSLGLPLPLPLSGFPLHASRPLSLV